MEAQKIEVWRWTTPSADSSKGKLSPVWATPACIRAYNGTRIEGTNRAVLPKYLDSAGTYVGPPLEAD